MSKTATRSTKASRKAQPMISIMAPSSGSVPATRSVDPSSFGLQVSIEYITPEAAGQYLKTMAKRRTYRPRKTAQYARDMIGQNWYVNGETIIFDDEGRLSEGYHRMNAIVESGITVPMLVVRGVSTKGFHTIDTGTPRNLGDVLTMDGVSNTAMVASAARLYCRYEDGGVASGSRPALSHTELLSFLEKHPQIEVSASRVSGMPQARQLLTPSVACFVHAYIAERDITWADLFIDQINTGANLSEGDPVFALRRMLVSNSLRKNKLRPEDILAYSIKAFNALFKSKRIVMLTFRRGEAGEAFPHFSI